MLSQDSSVDTILNLWPRTVICFVNRRMLCVGCELARFHSLREAALACGVDLDDLLCELATAISSDSEFPNEERHESD